MVDQAGLKGAGDIDLQWIPTETVSASRAPR
jgi:hypothetical protein